MSLFLAFLGVAILVIATPGPDTAITIRNTLLGGRGAGIATASGIAAGQLVWALATSAGAVALLLASEPAFLALKYAGAAYLVYLGIGSLRAAFRPSGEDRAGTVATSRRRLGWRAAFGQGLVSNLGNPKMAVFFVSLLPQFVPAGGESFGRLLGLGCVFAALTLVWLAAYAVMIARAGDVLRRPAIRRAIEAVTGSLLIGLGVRVATEAR